MTYWFYLCLFGYVVLVIFLLMFTYGRYLNDENDENDDAEQIEYLKK